MSRQILRPVKVWTDAKGQPVRFVWRDVTYRGRVLLVWKLSDKWWDADRYSDRTYYRMETTDHQIFELYRDAAKDGLWVLSHISVARQENPGVSASMRTPTYTPTPRDTRIQPETTTGAISRKFALWRRRETAGDGPNRS